MNDIPCFIGLCTVPTLERAKIIGRYLVENHLVACVNIITNLTSIYQWKEKICEDTEQLLVLKTQKNNINLIEKKIKENHPYEIPEIIFFPITDGYSPYLEWIIHTTN